MKKLYAFILFLLSCLFIFAQTDQTPLMDQYGHSERGLFTETIMNATAGNHIKSSDWISLGPDGGDVLDIAIDLNNTDRLFAAAGIPYFSEDMGASWTILDDLASMVSGQVTSFEANSDGVIIAGGLYDYGKVYRSTDAGLSWQSKTLPVNGCYILDATFDPGDPNTLYLALTANGSSSRVLIKSDDAGATWSVIDLIEALPTGYSLINVIVDPDNSQNIYCIGNYSFSDALVVASFDGGDSWADITGNLPSGKPYNHLAVAGGTLYLAGGQLFGGQILGVYKTDDNGSSWQNISSTFPNKVSNFILIDPDNADKLYVASEGDGIYYSEDAGASWSFDGIGSGANGSARYLVFEPGNSETIYAGFLSLAVCKSTDAARNWEYANKGIATLLLNDIEVNTADPQKMLVGFEGENSGGCYLSNDGGVNWELVTGLPATRYSQVTYGADGSMYAWSNGPTTVGVEGIYKSSDGGVTWASKGPNMGANFETQVFALYASETNPDLILVGGNSFGSYGWESMIYRSINGCDSWENTFMGPAYDSFKYLYIDPNSDDQIIYAAYKSDTQGGFLKSTDEGENWDYSMVGLPNGVLWCSVIISDPDNSDILYGGVGGYGFMPGSVYRSENAGGLWEFANMSLGFNYDKITDMMVSPDNSGVIYAATSSDGVYLSSDTAASWSESNDHLAASNITGFSNPFWSDDMWKLCASTYTNSAFMTDVFIPNPTAVPNMEQEAWLCKIFPNPSNGSFIIEMEKAAVQTVEVRIFSPQGRSVYETSVQSYADGRIYLNLDLPSGIWMLKLVGNDQVYTGKIMIR